MPSLPHLLVFGAIALLLFGSGRIAGVMGELAQGIKSFKKGLADDEPVPTPQVKSITHIDGQPAPAAAPSVEQVVTPPQNPSA
jgi:sec-independent protein translocase protein TatA